MMDEREIIAAAQKSLRAWMERVLDKTGWSKLEWARQAKTTPTNITRFMKGEHKSLPNARILMKLAMVAPIPLVIGQQPSAKSPQQIDGRHRVTWLMQELDTIDHLSVRPLRESLVNGGPTAELTDLETRAIELRDELRARVEHNQ